MSPRGIAIALLLSIPFWVAIITLVFIVLDYNGY